MIGSRFGSREPPRFMANSAKPTFPAIYPSDSEGARQKKDKFFWERTQSGSKFRKTLKKGG